MSERPSQAEFDEANSSHIQDLEEELAQLREREMVLVEACKSAHDVFITQVGADYNDRIHAAYLKCCAAIDPSQTADQVLRWHVEWMMKQESAYDLIYAAWHGAGVDIAGGNWNRFANMLPECFIVPPLPKESKE